MQKNSHFPRFVRAGHHKNLSYLIMQMVGPNLDYLRKQCNRRKFSLATAHHLAYQCLEALQALHLENLIHRDIRPSHFAIGSTAFDCRNVYILDYHLVRRFTRKDGQVRPARHKVRTKGCFKYASPNSLKNQDISRPDDLYSWFYMNIEFLKGRLPWRRLKNKADILHVKLSNIDDLLNDLPKQWSKIFKSVSKLTFEQDPPYYEYKSLIFEVINQENISFDEPFDWELGGESYSNFSEPLAVYLRMPSK
uniref:Protein kinase domain-containing protein n=1 Tax=Romanomermis culicivorax TaxID=13658 RepID=A0A915KCP8_ROMCU